MELIPAIDILGGRVVRLVQGDFDRQTGYGDDPAAMARRWVLEGATRLHLVDLDGAREGRLVQFERIVRVLAAVGIPCQVAGGLRDRDAVAAMLGAGADRVVMGTALLRDPGLATALVKEFGVERLIAALDVRGGLAVGEGWRMGGTSAPVLEALHVLQGQGIRRFAVTAIARDGVSEGPDLALLTMVRDAAPDVALIASGGIATVGDIRALAELGIHAAILGRALYEGRLSLAEASPVAASASPRAASPAPCRPPPARGP